MLKCPVLEVLAMYYGVDGCSDGWIAVWYDETGYVDSDTYNHIDELWSIHRSSADRMLIDVPIGLRESSSRKRPCDDQARNKLGQKRASSVFPVPIRPAVHAESYEDAKSLQEKHTDGSLGSTTWGIADKIAELDSFLRETEPTATGTIREAHPEVCFWAINNKTATDYSKTGQPAAAFCERLDILEQVEPEITQNFRDAGRDVNPNVENDDIIDAFALALTASPQTGQLRTLPEEWPDDDPGDPLGLPMEMVHAYPPHTERKE
jgi:predicted RNase H-like nuclease